MRKNNTKQFKCLLLKQEKASSELQAKLQELITKSEEQDQLRQLNTQLLVALLDEINGLRRSVLRCRFRK